MGWAAGKLWVRGGSHQKPGTLGFPERKVAGAAEGTRLPTEWAEVALQEKN